MQEVKDDTRTAFESAAQEERASILSEFRLLPERKQEVWLAPILIVPLAAGAPDLLCRTGAAPLFTRCFDPGTPLVHATDCSASTPLLRHQGDSQSAAASMAAKSASESTTTSGP